MSDNVSEKNEKNDNSFGIKDGLEAVGGLASAGGILSAAKNALFRPAYAPPTNFVGDAVGIPISQGIGEVVPTAAQAFQGLALPEAAVEAAAFAPEVAELAGASLIPGLGPLALAGAGATGLYFLGKKLLEHKPDDRVAQSIVNHEVAKKVRASNLTTQMFSHPVEIRPELMKPHIEPAKPVDVVSQNQPVILHDSTMTLLIIILIHIIKHIINISIIK